MQSVTVAKASSYLVLSNFRIRHTTATTSFVAAQLAYPGIPYTLFASTATHPHIHMHIDPYVCAPMCHVGGGTKKRMIIENYDAPAAHNNFGGSVSEAMIKIYLAVLFFHSRNYSVLFGLKLFVVVVFFLYIYIFLFVCAPRCGLWLWQVSWVIKTNGGGSVQAQYRTTDGKGELWINDANGIPEIVAVDLGRMWHKEETVAVDHYRNLDGATGVAKTHLLPKSLATVQSIKVPSAGVYLVVRCECSFGLGLG